MIFPVRMILLQAAIFHLLQGRKIFRPFYEAPHSSFHGFDREIRWFWKVICDGTKSTILYLPLPPKNQPDSTPEYRAC